jgi:hypothetical protein
MLKVNPHVTAEWMVLPAVANKPGEFGLFVETLRRATKSCDSFSQRTARDGGVKQQRNAEGTYL